MFSLSRSLPFLLLSLIFFNITSYAQVSNTPEPLKSAEHRVGERIPDVAFTDLDGNTGSLSDFQSSSLLVIFANKYNCPLCKRFAPTLNRIVAEYSKKDISFLMLNTSKTAEVSTLKTAVKELGFESRYLLDKQHELAKALALHSTTEVFVLDSRRTLRYRGPINDQYGIGFSLPKARREYLREALDSLLEAEEVETPALSSPGCVINFGTFQEDLSKVTYHNRISRIIQRDCQYCHRPGEAAPFSLLSYNDVIDNDSMIEYVVENKIMPPWFADPNHGKWANDRSLTDRDKQALFYWINHGTPEGKPEEGPLPRKFEKGWGIGKPDVVLEVPKVFKIPKDGVVPYQYFLMDNPFTEDKWISEMELRATAPQVVHHMLVVLVPEGTTINDLSNIGVSNYFTLMVPGELSNRFPSGLAKKLPKGAKLLFQIHYTPNGIATTDQPRLGLKFSNTAPKKVVESSSVYDFKFVIPAGASHHVVTATHTFAESRRILSFVPHMHLRGKSFRYELILPDGSHETVLNVPNYNFDWQLCYKLATPILAPKGSILKGTAVYDNSADNPYNPDPTKDVKFGEQTDDEMMIGYFDMVPE